MRRKCVCSLCILCFQPNYSIHFTETLRETNACYCIVCECRICCVCRIDTNTVCRRLHTTVVVKCIWSSKLFIFFFTNIQTQLLYDDERKKREKNTAYKHTGDTGSKHIWPISYIDFYMCINVNFLIWICFIYLFIFSSSSSLSLDCCMFHHFAANLFVSLDLRAHTHLSLEVKELSVDIAETQWDKVC